MLDTEPTGGGSDTAASATADLNGTTSTSTTPNGTGAAPRRRRRATPAADGPPPTEAVTAEPATADAPQPPAAETPAPRRRRAATRPASAPAPAAVVTEPEPPAAEAAPAAEPAVTPRRTRSARRPAGQRAVSADPVEAQPEPAAEVAVAAAAPAGTTRGRRRGAKTTEPAPVEAPPAELLEAAVVETPAAVVETPAGDAADVAPPRSRRRRSTAVQFAPPVDESAEPAAEVVVEKAVLPPIGALFQAPDPANATPARRRRATRPEAPAAAPMLDADGQPIEDELAEELIADATDAVVLDALDADASLASEEVDTDEDAEEDSEDDGSPSSASGRRRRRGRRGRGRGRPEDSEGAEAEGAEPVAPADAAEGESAETAEDDEMEDDGRGGTRRRRRRRRRGGAGDAAEPTPDDPPNTVVRVRNPRRESQSSSAGGSGDDEVRGLTGSTRLEAKRQRRREGREQGKRRPPVLTEAEFLARREAVDRVMVVRQSGDRTQIAVLEDTVLVEHYVTKASATSYAGNVYLGKVQNVLPSMEAAFVDIGKGRNAVLYAGEVNYDASGIEGRAHRIEQALKPGQTIMVQVTKDPIGHKGSRLTSQISLPGRFLVYVPDGRVTGISRKLPDAERTRLKAILKRIMPEDAGVIVRTAAEGASEEDLERDVARLHAQWESIQAAAAKAGSSAPALLYAEPDLVVRVIRDIFNEDFRQLIVQGDDEWETVENYVAHLAPDLAPRLTHWVDSQDAFSAYRVDEQLTKALDRKVWLPSGGSLVIDRTEAMIVVDVNTGKFVGKGGNLEETVTKNNLEAAEEVVRQLRLRDLGGIIVIDFIDMVLESNRELVLRRLMECLGRDRTKHQVAEVTSLGLVQMTRKRVGQGLLESFSETCPTCQGRGFIVHMDHGAPTVPDRGEDLGRPDGNGSGNGAGREAKGRTAKGGRDRGSRSGSNGVTVATVPDEAPRAAAAAAIAKIAAASAAHLAAHPDGPVVTEQGWPAEQIVAAREVEVAAESVTDGATEAPSGTRTSRRGRRGASAPAGSPTPAEAADVAPADVTALDTPAPVEDAPAPAEPADEAAAASRPRRRRGGSGQGATSPAVSARDVASENGAAQAPVPVAVAVAVEPMVAPAAAGGAPRRRRAASRPAGPAAVSPVPS
jgi:ribonuclease E